MKDIQQYGLLNDDEWECLPWLPDPRPPFKIWVNPEDIAPFLYEEDHSGVTLFQFESDDDIFCVFSQYVDDLLVLAKIIRATCNDEELMCNYLKCSILL